MSLNRRKSSFFAQGEDLKIHVTQPQITVSFGEDFSKPIFIDKRQKELRALRRQKVDKKLAQYDILLNGYSTRVRKKILKLGVPVATIESGSIFGQYALVDNGPRNAGIFCLEECYFMTFDQDTFNLIKSFYSQEFNQRRNFIQSILPIIETFGEERKIKTIQYFEPDSIQRVIN